jgi:flagellar basal-body rod modification protein FlgD
VSIGATEATTPTYVGYVSANGKTTEATTTAATGNGLSSTATTSSSSKDKDMFLQLLVAQMKYQDPTSPADSTQFLTQSAQFTNLEKMENLSNQMGLMLSSQMAFGASSLVGRSVSYTLPDGTSGAGTASGVEFGATGPVLTVGGVSVPISSVVSVTDGSTPATGTGTSTAATTGTTTGTTT